MNKPNPSCSLCSGSGVVSDIPTCYCSSFLDGQPCQCDTTMDVPCYCVDDTKSVPVKELIRVAMEKYPTVNCIVLSERDWNEFIVDYRHRRHHPSWIELTEYKSSPDIHRGAYSVIKTNAHITGKNHETWSALDGGETRNLRTHELFKYPDTGPMKSMTSK